MKTGLSLCSVVKSSGRCANRRDNDVILYRKQEGQTVVTTQDARTFCRPSLSRLTPSALMCNVTYLMSSGESKPSVYSTLASELG